MNQTSDAIASNLFHVRQSIAEVARLAGRDPGGIRLIAISKNHPHEAVAAAIASGHKDFGESTIQEAVPKISQLANKNKSVIWHFIGHLQTNKAKFVPRNFSWLHSLDSPDLARKLSRRALEQSENINILIEVNVGRDPGKHGVAPDALVEFVEQLLKENLPALLLRGLMTIGPHNAQESEIRRCFASLRELRDECGKRLALPGFTELSMGMSSDYAEAIKEGATMLRIGTAIFGARDYSKK